MRLAALCAGYGGLEMGLALAGVDFELAWYAENDPHASKVMAHHYPEVPNVGDLTALTKAEHARRHAAEAREAGDPTEPSIDIVAAGFP